MSEFRRHIMASSTNENLPFYFESIDGGTLGFAHHISNTVTPSFQYSMDGGITWQNFPVTTVAANGDAVDTISVDAGEKVLIKGINFTLSQEGTPNEYHNCFRTESGKWNIGGNLCYLYKGIYNNTYYIRSSRRLFYNCTILSAKNLYMSLDYIAYGQQYMFADCNLLIYPPKMKFLSFETRIRQCEAMFAGCTSLTSAPELPATTLSNNCYQSMFYGCTSLTTAPELPATTLASYCYNSMFQDCTSLTTAPELPATTLASYCYYYMFYNCSSLTSAPELPATTLAQYCYQYMFQGCTSLEYIKVNFTSWVGNTTISWLRNVKSIGTFVKPIALPSTRGISNIPSGWTIEEF